MRTLPLIIIWLYLVPLAAAQSIRVEADTLRLRDALLTVRDQTNVDVVFSEQLVRGELSICSYAGNYVGEALSCVLRHAGLQAHRIRRNQYVVVKRHTPPDSAGAKRDVRWTLSGFVVDAESEESLPGAHVYLPDLRAGTTTNDAGYFALPSLPPGAYRAQFSFIGYAAQEVYISADSAMHTIALRPTTIQGDAILVEDRQDDEVDAAGVPGMLAESAERLQAMPSYPGDADLLQALQWFPGVRKAGEVNGGMVVRGSPPDQNLYMLDGAPIYHPWHAFSLISTFQTETFKDVKLYRGSFPSEYGGRISAVLDAQMKDGSRRRPQVLIAASPISGRFIIETPATRHSSFMVAGRRSYVDRLIGREHPVENEEGVRDTLRTGYYFYDASAKYTHRFGRGNRLSVSYYHGGDDLDLRLPFDLSLDFSSWLRPAELFFEVAHRWENTLLSARYQHLLSDRAFATVTAYSSTYGAREAALLRPTSTAVMQSDYRVDLRETGAKVDVQYFRSLAHQLQVGTHVMLRAFESSLDAVVRRSPGAVDDVMQTSRAIESEVAVYVQDIWQPTERWTVRPGIRYSIFGDGLYSNLSPGLSFEYVVDPRFLRLKAGAGRQVQYLHRLRDRYSFTYDLVTSRWIPAGEDVRPSRGLQFSGGFVSRVVDGLTLEGEAYWREVEDILVPKDEFRTKDALVGPGIAIGELLGQYVVGDARAYGVELSAALERGPWSVRLSYAGGKSLSRARELGESSFRASRYDVPRSLRALGAHEMGRWSFSAAFEMRSGYPTTVPVAQYVIGDPLDDDGRFLHRPYVNNGRLPPYLRADLSVERRFRLLGADWAAQFHLFNATGRRNVMARQYVPSPDGMHVQSRRGLPILPLLELEMRI